MSMKVIKNPDQKIVEDITAKLKANDGYCPCAIVKSKDTKCMCKEFRDMVKNKTPGQCHCGLHVLIDVDDK